MNGEADRGNFSLARVVEAILFASQRSVSTGDLRGILKGAADAHKADPSVAAFGGINEPLLRAAIEELRADYSARPCAFELRESAAGWQLVTKPAFAPWLRQLFPEYRSARLSVPGLETLAIIAYRQPITRADIEAVRGVAVDGVLQTLMDRGLIKIAGRAEIPGRPLLYGTTQQFMDHFGLRNLDELPNAEELRRIQTPAAAAQAGPLAEPAAPKESPGAAGSENPAIPHSVQTEKPS